MYQGQRMSTPHSALLLRRPFWFSPSTVVRLMSAQRRTQRGAHSTATNTAVRTLHRDAQHTTTNLRGDRLCVSRTTPAHEGKGVEQYGGHAPTVSIATVPLCIVHPSMYSGAEERPRRKTETCSTGQLAVLCHASRCVVCALVLSFAVCLVPASSCPLCIPACTADLHRSVRPSTEQSTQRRRREGRTRGADRSTETAH